MRAGGCSVQQALTIEAASVIKQAVTLARRRGHAQVTPLHVASTMLGSSTGLLRTACLQSHSHPLQCKALELCFNVALNRLPASSASSMLGTHHSQHPSISNALIAAFKRAQAHQRRGSIENQQQPLLAVKIEIEQLIISILDDPSVSRVMREASFSSTQVKSNVEQAVSLEICSQTPVSSNKSKESHPPLSQIGVEGDKTWLSNSIIRNEDVTYVLENLMNKKRSKVIVGECLATIEGVVKRVIDKVEKRDVHESLRDVKFVNISLFSFAHLSRDEVEKKLGEIKNMVMNCYMGSGIVLYLGDLKWASENRASLGEKNKGFYCPLEHMIIELGKLVCGIGENSRFWLMGIATFQTYMRCKSGHPSLETIWCLHPLTIPADSLSLSLITDSDQQSHYTSKKVENGSRLLRLEGGEENGHQLTCCGDCSAKFEREAQSLQSSICNSDSTTSSLPAWLQNYKNETKGINSNDQDCLPVKDLFKKWNSICSSIHKHPNSSERTLTFTSILPSTSTLGFSYDQENPNLSQTNQDYLKNEPKSNEPTLRIYIPDSSTPNSTTSSDIMEMEYVHSFKEFNDENLETLCIALEKKVPWQKDIIHDIATTILECRSGKVRRKGKARNTNDVKEETWFFFQGLDIDGKEKIAKELARLIFGSQTNFVTICLSTFSSTRADSIEDSRNKRSRDEQSCSYIERFAEKVSSNPRRVFLIEDVEQADYCSQIRFKRAIERGTIMDSNGDEVDLCDAIVILSCESFSSRSRACSPPSKQKLSNACDEDKVNFMSLDLNISIDDDNGEDQSIDDIGLLESVDRQIMFKIQEL